MSFPQNAYPNPENFQEVSFPQEVTPPTVDPDAGDMICVTYSREWTAVLMAACGQLQQFASWTGDSDAKKLAVDRATNLAILLQTDIGCDMSGCCHELVESRVTSDGGLEIRIDGGEWIPDPSDPRVTAPLYPPLTFDDHHTKCDAATNVAEHLNDVITETSDQLGGTGSILEIATVIVAAIFALFIAPESLPVLVPLILPLISAILFLGQAAFDAYFDSTVHDEILCAIYCTIGDDGTFTDAQYSALIAKLTTDLPASAAKDYFVQIVGRIGLVGMNDYASIGTSADADCSSCDCGCDLDNWAVFIGNEVSRDATTITVDSVVAGDFGSGQSGVIIESNANDHCCQVTFEALSGAITVPLAITCGNNSYQDGGTFTAFTTGELRSVLVANGSPFRVKFTFAS